MRPGAPGQLQLNPFKVRLASGYAAKKFPKIGNMYPGMKMPMGGGMGLGGMGMGMGKGLSMGLGMPGRPLGGGMPNILGGGGRGY